MKKKIYAVCALVLIAAMFFSFESCDAGTTDTEQTTVAAMSEMPVGKEAMVNYYNSVINAVKVKKPAVKKFQSTENVSNIICGTEDGERNTLLEKAVPTLKKFVFAGTKKAFEESRNAETKYGEDLTALFPVSGESWSSTLTAADVESAEIEASEDNSSRTLTLVIKEPSVDVVKISFILGSEADRVAAVMEFRDKLKGYISFTDIESLTYTECRIICVINTEDNTVASVEYIRTEKITTTITGDGTLAGIGTLPCSFEYTYGEKYEMNWTDPSTTTTAEAD